MNEKSNILPQQSSQIYPFYSASHQGRIVLTESEESLKPTLPHPYLQLVIRHSLILEINNKTNPSNQNRKTLLHLTLNRHNDNS